MVDENLEIPVPASLVAEVVWSADGLLQATSINQQASWANRLSNATSDLATWHPRWDIETGEIDEA